MYESFFGFEKRPFNAMPDTGCFIPIQESCEAAGNLVSCASQGRGIGVLTAPAGLGKTLICQRVAGELESEFSIVFLPSANFLTRRSLLQAILFELGHSYVRMGDQELRLAILSALRRLKPGYRGMALVVDEAHLLVPRMLEELRALTNFADAGEPLVRLIVAGNLQLEETLSRPALDSFNQRIGCQAVLQPFARQQSIQYVQRRIAWAGANCPEVIAADALDLICEASDGSPRCLNQLCDHSLFVAYMRSQRPVAAETVCDALDELKHLPLTWNHAPSQRISRRDPMPGSQSIVSGYEPISTSSLPDNDPLIPMTSETLGCNRAGEDDPSILVCEDAAVPGFSAEWDADCDASVEIGAVVEFSSSAEQFAASPAATFELHTEMRENTQDRLTMMAPHEMAMAFGNEEIPLVGAFVADRSIAVEKTDFERGPAGEDEEVVFDRYAALDAAIGRLTRTMISARAVSREAVSLENEMVFVPCEPSAEALTVEVPEEDNVGAPGFDIVLPEDEHAEEDAPVLVAAAHGPEPPKPRGAARSYQYLFSELRRRRRL